jgi:hypothetical protein
MVRRIKRRTVRKTRRTVRKTARPVRLRKVAKKRDFSFFLVFGVTLIVFGMMMGFVQDEAPTAMVAGANCIDSDGGIKIYEQGTVSTDVFAEDACMNDGKLKESFCNNGKIDWLYHQCKFGCVNGECLKG